MDVAVCRDEQLDAFRLDVLQGLARAQKCLEPNMLIFVARWKSTRRRPQ